MLKLLLVVAAALFLALPASVREAPAVTLTFDEPYPNFDPYYYTEKGISVVPNGYFGTWLRQGSIHMDPPGGQGSWASLLEFSSPGNRINVFSVDIISLTFDRNLTPFENVLFQGFRNGVEVAKKAFQMSLAAYAVDTVILGRAFRNLDTFTIAAIAPAIDPDVGYLTCNGCGHFDIDNVSIAPVPLPAAAPLLLAGIGALAALGLVRRRSRQVA